ncbi:hypothetical protein JOF42_000759 [Microbacterium phyllosphaerae]|uniref:Uncharacterized protein n=1 Tax=Microbacterium phyllosphaerae TaxID=124798 RepID=A0ABS4WM35_9MICO|nr:hypothetical protein [Microbacterium phyllosphaerae]MBP2377264.1 hypothetical protein [Microbacterium phyllosphaerae]
MTDAYSCEELVSRLPVTLGRLSEVAEYDVERMRAIAREEGLEHFPRPRIDDQRALRLQHSDGDAASVARKLRAAIAKVLGKPTGTDKVYSSGPFICELSVRDDLVRVQVRPQRSFESIGAAAAAWMSGTPFSEWAEQGGAAIMHPSDSLIRAPRVDERSGRLSFAVELGSGLHPAGLVVNDLPARREALAAYITEQVGEPEAPPYLTQRKAWLRGQRQLMLAGYRGSGNHSLTFTHDGGGAVAW